jgi:hypothetical protein
MTTRMTTRTTRMMMRVSCCDHLDICCSIYVLQLIAVIYSIAQSLGHFKGGRLNRLAVSMVFMLESVRTNQWYWYKSVGLFFNYCKILYMLRAWGAFMDLGIV